MVVGFFFGFFLNTLSNCFDDKRKMFEILSILYFCFLVINSVPYWSIRLGDLRISLGALLSLNLRWRNNTSDHVSSTFDLL